MEDGTAPAGLFLSLDQLIKKNTQGRQQQRGGRGVTAGRSQPGGRGGFGRKGRGFAVSGGVAKAGGGAGGGGRFRQQGGSQRGAGARPQQRRSDPTAYRRYQQCYLDEDTGDVLVIYHETTIVRITPQGDVTLNSGGFHTETTLNSFNDALGPIGVKVSAPEAGHPADSQWLVSDGRSLFRFTDGMTLVSKGPQHAARGPLVLQGFQNPDAAVASAASNAAAAAVGILPKNAPGVPLELGNPKRSWARGAPIGGGGGFVGGGGRFGGSGGRFNGRGRFSGAGGGMGGRGMGQRQQPQQWQAQQQRQQQQWQEQDMDYGDEGFEEPQLEDQQYMEEPEVQYGSGMRADGYDPDEMPSDTRNDAARTRARLRAQGRL